jgi:WD40 repeat protein
VYVPSVSHLQGWDLETRSLLWTVAAGGGEDYIDFVFCLFTPDGRLVTRSGEDARELAFWDPRTGAVVQTVELPGNYPTAARLAGRDLVMLVFDEAGKNADGWPCTAVRIDLATGEVTHRRALGRLPMNAAFSPDGSRLAAGAGSLDVYDTATGERVARYACGARVRELSFSDDGQRIVLGDQAGRVHVLTLDGWTPTSAEAWTPDELEALRRETAAREPVRPAPQPARKKSTRRAAAPNKKSAQDPKLRAAQEKPVTTKRPATKRPAAKKKPVAKKK